MEASGKRLECYYIAEGSKRLKVACKEISHLRMQIVIIKGNFKKVESQGKIRRGHCFQQLHIWSLIVLCAIKAIRFGSSQLHSREEANFREQESKRYQGKGTMIPLWFLGRMDPTFQKQEHGNFKNSKKPLWLKYKETCFCPYHDYLKGLNCTKGHICDCTHV